MFGHREFTEVYALRSNENKYSIIEEAVCSCCGERHTSCLSPSELSRGVIATRMVYN